MSHDTRKAWNIFLIVALIIACARLLEGQADGTVVIHVYPSPNLVAMTTCSSDNKVVVVYLQPLDSLEERLTKVHEDVHVRQMKDNCKAVQERYRNEEKLRIYMEQEAYCENSKERLKAGQPLWWVRDRFKDFMKMLYGVEDAVCPYIPP